jgi:NADH-quinone oxidoreductase subunit A
MLIQVFEYLNILIFLILSALLSTLLILLSYVLAPKLLDDEKLSVYECGFRPFQDARLKLDIQFYIVAILFLLFDLEIAFLFPWVLSVSNLGFLGFSSGISFLFVLVVGFIYEWKKGALNWSFKASQVN